MHELVISEFDNTIAKHKPQLKHTQVNRLCASPMLLWQATLIRNNRFIKLRKKKIEQNLTVLVHISRHTFYDAKQLVIY